MRYLATLLLLALLLLLPNTALAWGFGVHLQLGNQLLNQLSTLPPHLQQLLGAFPADFMYGCISADITIGKKYTHYLKHCHSWIIGEQILNAASNDAQRACAYGYLSHLAADTIAHAYMVPFKMVRSYNTAFLKHLYWELRFESQIPEQIWLEARLLAQQDFSQHDQLLRGVLTNTLFSFGTNKQLFNSMLLVSRIKRWRKMLHLVDQRSRWEVNPEERQEYLLLAEQAIISILSDPHSPYRQADPTGERAINVAKQLRTNLKDLWLNGKLPQQQSAQLINELKIEFRAAITEPQRLLRLVTNQH
ncbi:MAG: zinc dependent phospholipase C family protein [Thermodesulfobacteriota bacterium]|nr:zinc dependent phospholipase C family protein [Thermodesulfobacteriota bacterium]